MIGYKDLPDDNADIAKIEIDFPRLIEDSETSCPCAMKDIVDYLDREGEAVKAGDLEFIRTARVEDHSYWVWRFRDESDEKCYVVVSYEPTGHHRIGYDSNFYGLTPEQFILGDYHRVL